MTDDPPKNLYAIADCYVAMGRVDDAVQQLREIENFFVNESSRASLRIAYVLRGAGRQAQFVAELASVLKKYPRSGESSQAHHELECMGRSDIIRGGVDAD
jgi:tetratricopeptide (TPR) repeat protein